MVPGPGVDSPRAGYILGANEVESWHAADEKIGPTGKDILIRDVAIAAVMAGCKPKHMPILIAAFKAMAASIAPGVSE